MRAFVPHIVGMGGTTRPGSFTELALRYTLRSAERVGARTTLFSGPAIELPMYAQACPRRCPAAQELISALRLSHGIILASPGYHGSISGLIKNALDYVEDMGGDSAAYFDGRAVGCIACAHGWQATGSTLAALRSIIHALRGWPTPIGVTVNSSQKVFDRNGECTDLAIAKQLDLMAQQIVEFATMRAGMTTTNGG